MWGSMMGRPSLDWEFKEGLLEELTAEHLSPTHGTLREITTTRRKRKKRKVIRLRVAGMVYQGRGNSICKGLGPGKNP